MANDFKRYYNTDQRKEIEELCEEQLETKVSANLLEPIIQGVGGLRDSIGDNEEDCNGDDLGDLCSDAANGLSGSELLEYEVFPGCEESWRNAKAV